MADHTKARNNEHRGDRLKENMGCHVNPGGVERLRESETEQ